MNDAAFLQLLAKHHADAALMPFSDIGRADLLRCLARGEAEGEADPGPEAVCWVAMNRVRTPSFWGSSVHEVVLWPQQFSCFWASLAQREHAMRAEISAPTPRLVAAVQRVLYADALGFLDRDPTGGALLYYNPDACSPPWKDRVVVTRRIGYHLFCVDPHLTAER